MNIQTHGNSFKVILLTRFICCCVFLEMKTIQPLNYLCSQDLREPTCSRLPNLMASDWNCLFHFNRVAIIVCPTQESESLILRLSPTASSMAKSSNTIFFAFLRLLRIPGLKGFSMYDLLELYILGIIRGALTRPVSCLGNTQKSSKDS